MLHLIKPFTIVVQQLCDDIGEYRQSPHCRGSHLDASWIHTQAQFNDFLESQNFLSHLGDVIDRLNDKACVGVCVCVFGCVPMCECVRASVCVCVCVCVCV